MNWNERLHSWCPGKLHRLGLWTKGYIKREGALRDGLVLAWVQHSLI